MMDALCVNSKFIIRIQRPIGPRWPGQLRQGTSTLRKSYRRWLRHIEIGRRTSHWLYLLIELQLFHRSNIFFRVWYGSRLTGWERDLVISDLDGNQARWGWVARGPFVRLNFIEEKRMIALRHRQCYQKRIARARKSNPEYFEKRFGLEENYPLERSPMTNSGPIMKVSMS